MNAFEMLPQDVMPILGCSERTAKEYIDLLRLLKKREVHSFSLKVL
jgi:hypothetical protein